MVFYGESPMADGRRAQFLYDIGFAGRVRGGLYDTADETAWRAEIGWPVFRAGKSTQDCVAWDRGRRERALAR